MPLRRMLILKPTLAKMDFELHYGKRANKRRKMYNGMIPCQIYMYFDRPVKPVRK